jgi:hypothetical protein
VPTLNLPVAGRKLAPYTMRPPREFPAAAPPFNRIGYAAAHVVADPLADGDPWLDAAIDWERTVGSCGRSGSASPRRWTPRNAAWGSTGRPRSN